MPPPSARTKCFLSRTILKLSRTKILSMVKNSIFCFQKSFKMKLPDWKNLENLSSIRNIHIQWLLKVKNGLFNPGQNFCPGQFQYCPGQKIFCPGRWTRQKIDSILNRVTLEWHFLIWSALKICFQLKLFILNDFWK